MYPRLYQIKLIVKGFIVIILVLVYFLCPLWIDLTDEGFNNLIKCPACFGTSLCSSIKNKDIELTGFSALNFMRYIDRKNVYFGHWKSRNIPVVVKKLGFDSELIQLDEHLCQLFGNGEGVCNVVKDLKKTAQMTEFDEDTWEALHEKGFLHGREWAQCDHKHQVPIKLFIDPTVM